jgi:hypothetical protein
LGASARRFIVKNDRPRSGWRLAFARPLIALVVALQALPVQRVLADGASATGQKAAEAYKNIQVLKDLPAEQLLPTMFFMRASLGVSCDHCHVDFDHFESDANRVKQKAREMMRMVQAVNRDLFEGERRVTCNTCHRAQPRPSAPLPFASITASPADAAPAGKLAPTATVPTVDQVFDAYLRATGGITAQSMLATSQLIGSRVASEGWTAPLEIQLGAPDKIRVAFMLEGPWVHAFDGATGWSQDNHGVHDLPPGDVVLLRREAAFFRPHQLKAQYRGLTVLDPKTAGATDAVVVEGVLADGRREWLHFDPATGLLVRITAQTDTAFGPLPEQVTLEDYTEIGGVKVPVTINHLKPDFSYVDSVREGRHDLPADDALFARPSR